VLVMVLGVVIALGERDARADSCTSPDLIETMPPDNAVNVPINAGLSARYASIANYNGEPVQLDHVPVGGPTDAQTFDAHSATMPTFDATSGILQIVPPAPLTAGDSYVVHWPALRGLDTANVGQASDLHFRVGAEQDTLPPTFQGMTSVAWDVSRNKDPCTSSIDERYVFDLGLGKAADDGGRDSLTLIVFQTAGPDVEAGVAKQVRVQRIPPAGQNVSVTSAVSSAVGHVCFAAIVRDLTGRVSTGGSPVCVETVGPPFFYSCAVAPARQARGLELAALFIAAVALARRAKRRAAWTPAHTRRSGGSG
jgi:hypothetical protein